MAIRRVPSMRKFSPIKEPVAVASAEQWTQRIKDEKSAYRDLYTSVCGQLNTYSDMSAHGGSILEDLRTWETLMRDKTLNPNTMNLIRTSLQFQHSLNIAFGRLSTALSTSVCTKADFYSKDGKGESKVKDEKEILRLMQESEDKISSLLETYWKCYVEFFRQGYQLGVNIKSFFVKLNPEEPVFVEIPKAFGKELTKIWEDESELRIVMYILKYFEEYGSLDESVLKNNISPDAVKSLIQALEKGTIPLTGNSEAMAHVLLHWINSLTEAIFVQPLQKEFLEVANMVNLQVKREKMAALIGKLPRPNRVVLLAIIRGCVKIAREKSVGNSRYTQILLEKIADLAAALGPSLTRCTPEQVPLSHALIRYLVLNSELFFPLGCEEERIFVSETMKLGRVVRLTPELPPPPSLLSTPGSTSDSSSPKLMKIGERNSSKTTNSPTITLSPPSHSSSFLSLSGNLLNDSPSPSPSIQRNVDKMRSSPTQLTSLLTASTSDVDATFNFSNNTTSNPISTSLPASSSPISPIRSGSGIGIGIRTVSHTPLFSPPPTLSVPASFSSPYTLSSPTLSITTSSAPTSSALDPDDELGAVIMGKQSPPSPRKMKYLNINNNNNNTNNEERRRLKKTSNSSDSNSNSNSNSDSESEFPEYEYDPHEELLKPNMVTESVQNLSRNVVEKIERIRSIAAQSEDFDQAFAQVLKLKIVIPEVESIKEQLQMGMEFDKSELAKSRGDKLARIRTTVQIFSREIVYVMETVVSIFSTSEIPPETRATVSSSLVRILGQLG